MSLLRRTIVYLNKHKEVTRQELIRECITDYERASSLDSYIGYLHAAKYIEKIKPGHYKLIKHIPTLSTKRELIIEAYPNSYK
jgi:hypothetical protein